MVTIYINSKNNSISLCLEFVFMSLLKKITESKQQYQNIVLKKKHDLVVFLNNTTSSDIIKAFKKLEKKIQNNILDQESYNLMLTNKYMFVKDIEELKDFVERLSVESKERKFVVIENFFKIISSNPNLYDKLMFDEINQIIVKTLFLMHKKSHVDFYIIDQVTNEFVLNLVDKSISI